MAAVQEDAAFLKEIGENFLLCGICSDQYKNAKSLPCQHSFCQVCLDKLLKKSGGLNCPICRRSHEIPPGGAADLPNNFFVNELVEQFKKRDEKALLSKRCGTCDDGEGEVECLECDTRLCDECSRQHQRDPLTRTHILTSIDTEMGVDEQGGSEADSVGMKAHANCPKHPTKPLSFFCDTRDETVCVACTADDHRNCSRRHRRLDDAAKDYAAELTALARKLEAMNRNMEESKQEVQTVMDSLDRRFQEEKTKLDSHVEEIINSIRDTGRRFARQMKSEYEFRMTNLQVQMKEIEQRGSGAIGALEHIRSILQCGGAVQLMNAKKRIESQVEGIPVDSKSKVEPAELDHMIFQASDHLTELRDDYFGSVLGVASAEHSKFVKIPDAVGKNQVVSVTVATVSREGSTVYASAQVSGSLITSDGSVVQMDVTNSCDGILTLESPCMELQGDCQVSVWIGDEHIQGSPTTIKVVPLKFHACHGANVVLSSDSRIAERVQSYAKAICFTDRPIHVNEKISLEFREVEKVLGPVA
ncbi:E3 ubiquitin-protein ligase TRIM56-like [Ptychodera flava]|uniref:E3 ubiquitin-protein ligase TRIM56-like n=1 Tax=Ptychodera flava TaxID=63121 RepID=UPI003969ECCF